MNKSEGGWPTFVFCAKVGFHGSQPVGIFSPTPSQLRDGVIPGTGGRVQVLDLPPDKAKEVADLVSTTDGMIYHFYFDGQLPSGKIGIAEAVGHKPLGAAEYKASAPAK